MKYILLVFISSYLSLSVFSQNNEQALSKVEITELVKAVADSVESGYVFPEKGIQMKQHLLLRLKSKAYDQLNIQDLSRILRTDLISISQDKHIALRPLEKGNGKQPSMSLMDDNLQPFTELKILEGNIGYLRFDNFTQSEQAINGAMGAMLMLSNTDALIIDMRYNGGGNPLLIEFLIGMFLREQTHINSVYFRTGDRMFESYTAIPSIDYKILFRAPLGKATDTLMVVPEFDKLTEVPIYVLTSDYTFSAAEEFTYNLQALKRAVIIGDTTGGGAHPIRRLRVMDKIQLALPFARSINPITGTNWEHVGVRPDFPVNSELALAYSHVLALENISKTSQNGKINWILTQVKNQYNPYQISEADLALYIGKYEDRNIRVENGKLISQREGQRVFILTPLGKDIFELDERLRLHFVRDSNNQIIQVEMQSPNGIVGKQTKSL